MKRAFWARFPAALRPPQQELPPPFALDTLRPSSFAAAQNGKKEPPSERLQNER
jgi:hypothetical protein